MIRLFEQHKIRKVTELDGMWDFTMDGFSKSYRLAVPGCFEQHPDFLNHRGTGVYSRHITMKKDGNLRLDFKGVSHTADVYLDDEKIAHHYNAFTPFSAVVKHVKKGVHTLRVAVDNTFGQASSLHIPNDYYTYGGITRPVALEEVADVYCEYLHVTPFKTKDVWHAEIKVLLRNLAPCPKEVTVSCRLLREDGTPAEATEKTLSQKVTVPADSELTVSFLGEYQNVQPWSHSDPVLYHCHVILSEQSGAVGNTGNTDDMDMDMDIDVDVDDIIERIGFREISLSNRQLLVNGEPVFLMGFNRHEDYASVGCAVPLQLMVQDMDLMEAAGANAVRTCHYPNDERFLDLCDERGMLVWEESHARGLSLERMENPNFDTQSENCIREMIQNHYNHPSVIIWGILNECASETEIGRKKYMRQYAQIKSLDKSRPTTSATCRHLKDICLDLPDIVSFNMYSGWYKDVPVAETNRREIDWIDASGGAGKPVIVSELGAASLYGYRDRGRCKWSEERQADIIRENLEVYMADPDITGVFIWQFADCRVTEEDWFATRVRCHNNKGVVDEYRRPKLAYDTVSEIFHGFKR